MLRVLLYVPLVDHLAQELRRDLALTRLVLEHADTAAKRLELLAVGFRLILFADLFLLVFFDLCLGAAPLAAHLHQVGGHALGDCDVKKAIKSIIGAVLTAYFGRCMEDGCDFRIYIDIKIPGLLNSLVTFLDASPHPATELATEDRGTHVAYPVLAHLADLLLVRHVLEQVLLAVIEKSTDVLERQALILRHGDVSHVLGLDAYRKIMSHVLVV